MIDFFLVFGIILSSLSCLNIIYAVIILYKINKFDQNKQEIKIEFCKKNSKLFRILAFISILVLICDCLSFSFLVYYGGTNIEILYFIGLSMLFSSVPIITFISGYIFSKRREGEKKRQQEWERYKREKEERERLERERIQHETSSTYDNKNTIEVEVENQYSELNNDRNSDDDIRIAEALRQMKKESQYFAERKAREKIIKEQQRREEEQKRQRE